MATTQRLAWNLPSRLYGDFTKPLVSSSTHPDGPVTQFLSWSLPGRRCGSFTKGTVVYKNFFDITFSITKVVSYE